MAFQVELSMNLRHAGRIGEYRRQLIDLAERGRCLRHFVDYEVACRTRTAIRDHLIMTFVFPENEAGILPFLDQVKRMRAINLESVSYDNCTFILLYASGTYLRLMAKHKVDEYHLSKKMLLGGQFKYVVQAAS